MFVKNPQSRQKTKQNIIDFFPLQINIQKTVFMASFENTVSSAIYTKYN